MKQFKISLQGHFSALDVTLIWLIIFSIASVFIYFVELNKILIYCIWGVFIIMNFPVLLIHINYWFVDKNKVTQFDLDNKKIIQKVGKTSSAYSFEDIKCVTLTKNSVYDKSASLSVNRRAPWAKYFFYEIDFKNNKKIFLTSLSIDVTEFPLKVDQYRYETFQATN